jgi:hypothetical protein
MALELVNPSGIQPYGQFDGYDSVYLTVKGGEVATIISVAVSDGDRAAKDADGSDGYVGAPPAQRRPAVTTNLVLGSRPLFLVDDGLAGYGTLFGQVIGGVAGQIADGLGDQNGQLLGPHTATASGKLTLWNAGLYAVTLDAVDTTASTGLVPTNTSLDVGDALYATSAGLLTPDETAGFEYPTAETVVARFANFETYKGSSLVTTPVNLVSGVNSPVGQGQPQRLRFTRALIHFAPPIA